jgi:hypothetical protein
MTNRAKTKTIFVASSFSSQRAWVLGFIWEAAKRAEELVPYSISIERTDDVESFQDTIAEHVRQAIHAADLVIADISHSTPNVMFEIGYADALNRATILLADETVVNQPIDLGTRAVFFVDQPRIKFVINLAKMIAEAIEHPDAFVFAGTPSKAKDPAHRPTVFISYCHSDRQYLDRLRVHLRPLERLSQIDYWDDTRIRAGDKWKDEIERALARSAIAILMISADFLASDFIVDNELPPLLSNAESKGTVILPLILKPCRFLRDKNLSAFQALNDPKVPLIKLNEADQEDLYSQAAERVESELGNPRFARL